MKNIFLPLLLFILFSCSKDYVPRLSDQSVPVCEGFNITDESGYPLMVIGNPNVKLKPETGDRILEIEYSSNNDSSSNGIVNSSVKHIICYPNPPLERLNIINIKYPTNTKSTIWIVSATTNQQQVFSNFNLGAAMPVIGGVPLIYHEETNLTNISLDVSELSAGVYRIYIQNDRDLYWDNILIVDEMRTNNNF